MHFAEAWPGLSGLWADGERTAWPLDMAGRATHQPRQSEVVYLRWERFMIALAEQRCRHVYSAYLGTNHARAPLHAYRAKQVMQSGSDGSYLQLSIAASIGADMLCHVCALWKSCKPYHLCGQGRSPERLQS